MTAPKLDYIERIGAIKIEIRCMSCGELVERPSDAQWGVFRAGIHVHDRPDCIDRAMVKIER